MTPQFPPPPKKESEGCMMLFALRRRIALAICPDLNAAQEPSPTFVEVEVQNKPDGPFLRAWMVSDSLHWAKPGTLTPPAAAHCGAVPDASGRPNRTEQDATYPAPLAASSQFLGAGTRPSAPARRDAALNAGATSLRFRLPPFARTGDS